MYSAYDYPCQDVGVFHGSLGVYCVYDQYVCTTPLSMSEVAAGPLVLNSLFFGCYLVALNITTGGSCTTTSTVTVHEALLDYTLDSVSGHGLLDALFCACMVL